MKQRTKLALLLTLFAAHSFAQTNFYGLARKVATNEIFLSTINPTSGEVTNLSSSSLASSINLTGAALDPYNNFYHFISGNNINSINTYTGAMARSVAIYNPIADSYFENFRFNNSDTSLYGLARRTFYDSSTMMSRGEMFLAKINTSSGEITQISPSSVGQNYTLGGSAIDPFQKIYYFSSGRKFIGLDMYTGFIMSDTLMNIPDGDVFDNLAYSCVDTGIYGLIRKNFIDTLYPDPHDSTNMIITLDSTNVFLGKINPSSGLVTLVSPISIMNGGYSVNSGATIDPDNRLYYFSNGAELIGVSLVTGLVERRHAKSFTYGDYFDLMRLASDCVSATKPLRMPNTTAVPTVDVNSKITLAPNPVSNILQLSNVPLNADYTIVDMTGKVKLSGPLSVDNPSIDLEGLSNGVYFIKISSAKEAAVIKIQKL